MCRLETLNPRDCRHSRPLGLVENWQRNWITVKHVFFVYQARGEEEHGRKQNKESDIQYRNRPMSTPDPRKPMPRFAIHLNPKPETLCIVPIIWAPERDRCISIRPGKFFKWLLVATDTSKGLGFRVRGYTPVFYSSFHCVFHCYHYDFNDYYFYYYY